MTTRIINNKVVYVNSIAIQTSYSYINKGSVETKEKVAVLIVSNLGSKSLELRNTKVHPARTASVYALCSFMQLIYSVLTLFFSPSGLQLLLNILRTIAQLKQSPNRHQIKLTHHAYGKWRYDGHSCAAYYYFYLEFHVSLDRKPALPCAKKAFFAISPRNSGALTKQST